jgi:hypothetical protein
MRFSHGTRGITTIMVVGFMGVFMLIMGMLTSYAFEQAKYGRALLARGQALSIAEAGLEYYRWFLSHNPGNLQNGTGLPGPYSYTVSDPEGGTLGSASLNISGNYQCGVLQNIDITSTGAAADNPGFPRTISARYMQPSVAQYASLLNTNVYYGSNSSASGPYFANGGIHQNGTSNSTVSSAVSTWQCTTAYGCSSTQTQPGVFGTGSNSQLWQYPVTSINFAGMTTNLGDLRTYAQASGKLFTDSYVSAHHDSSGFHLIFNSDGTYDIYKVTDTTALNAYAPDFSTARTDYDVIKTQSYIGRYTPASSCGLVYLQGTTWIEGTVKGKVTLAVADPSSSYAPDVIISGNITYAASDGSTGLTVISEHSVRIPLNSLNTMSMRGIFVASGGYVGRDYYYSNGSYDTYLQRSSLSIIGTIVSTQSPALCYSDGTSCLQGYSSRSYSYDQVLAFTPPPFTPIALADYHYVLWSEQ